MAWAASRPMPILSRSMKTVPPPLALPALLTHGLEPIGHHNSCGLHTDAGTASSPHGRSGERAGPDDLHFPTFGKVWNKQSSAGNRASCSASLSALLLGPVWGLTLAQGAQGHVHACATAASPHAHPHALHLHTTICPAISCLQPQAYHLYSWASTSSWCVHAWSSSIFEAVHNHATQGHSRPPKHHCMTQHPRTHHSAPHPPAAAAAAALPHLAPRLPHPHAAATPPPHR